MKKQELQAIFCIVNAGFSDVAMEAAKRMGAQGGTVLHARGTANTEAEKRFRVAVSPEKEIVLILIPGKLKEDILHALYREVGPNTPGQGIAFSLPVDRAVGLTFAEESPEETKKEE